jgi:hypothetical protein
MQWSYGKGKFGPVTGTIDGCWQDLIELAHDSAQQPRDPALKADRYWIMPAIMHADATQRRIEDIDHMAAWLGLDIDTGNLSLAEIRLKVHGLPVVIHTTANSHADDQRWRVLIALDRSYSVAEHARLWRWFSDKFGNLIDPQTKNANRLFYLPADWQGSDNVLYVEHGGRPARVDSVLAMVPPDAPVIPPAPFYGVLQTPPAGFAILTPAMLATAGPGMPGAAVFSTMCASAKRFRLNGWTLTANDLAGAIMTARMGKPRPGLEREAERALQWANSHFTPETPIERMRRRILWQDEQTRQRRMADFKPVN